MSFPWRLRRADVVLVSLVDGEDGIKPDPEKKGMQKEEKKEK